LNETEHPNQLNLIQFVIIREKDEKLTSLSTYQASLIRLKINAVSRLMELMVSNMKRKFIDETFLKMKQ
jgi:hypothetical protein